MICVFLVFLRNFCGALLQFRAVYFCVPIRGYDVSRYPVLVTDCPLKSESVLCTVSQYKSGSNFHRIIVVSQEAFFWFTLFRRIISCFIWLPPIFVPALRYSFPKVWICRHFTISAASASHLSQKRKQGQPLAPPNNPRNNGYVKLAPYHRLPDELTHQDPDITRKELQGCLAKTHEVIASVSDIGHVLIWLG